MRWRLQSTCRKRSSTLSCSSTTTVTVCAALRTRGTAVFMCTSNRLTVPLAKMKMIVTVGVISTLHICKWKFSSVSSALLVTHNHWCSLPRFTYNQAQWKLKSYLCFCVQFSFFRNENIIVGCRNPRLYQLSSSSLALCAALQVDDMVRQRWGNMFSDLSWRICFTFQKCAYLMYKCHCTCKYHYAQNNNTSHA